MEDWASIYDGLTDEKIEAVDKIIKTRVKIMRDDWSDLSASVYPEKKGYEMHRQGKGAVL